MDNLDPRAYFAAEQLGGGVSSGNPDGAAGHLQTLGSAWLPSRSDDDPATPDQGLAFLVLLATPHRPASPTSLPEYGAPYFVAVAKRPADLTPWTSTRWRDLSAVEEVPTLAGALAAYAARLTGIAVEALTDGHGL